MPGSRPGSHAYDVERARLRKELERLRPRGRRAANEEANRILKDERGVGASTPQ